MRLKRKEKKNIFKRAKRRMCGKDKRRQHAQSVFVDVSGLQTQMPGGTLTFDLSRVVFPKVNHRRGNGQESSCPPKRRGSKKITSHTYSIPRISRSPPISPLRLRPSCFYLSVPQAPLPVPILPVSLWRARAQSSAVYGWISVAARRPVLVHGSRRTRWFSAGI